MADCKDGIPGCSCASRRPFPPGSQLSPSHAAGWSRFQRALCNLGRDRVKYRYTLNGEDHRDAVHILGYGSEEELKYCMMLWRQWHPELFEERSTANGTSHHNP